MILKKVLKNDHLFLIILIICYEFLLDKNLDITIFLRILLRAHNSILFFRKVLSGIEKVLITFKLSIKFFQNEYINRTIFLNIKISKYIYYNFKNLIVDFFFFFFFGELLDFFENQRTT